MSHEGRGLKWCVEKPRTAEDCHQKQGERHGTDSPLQLLKEPTLPMPWFWTTSLRDCEAISCPIYGTLYGSLRRLIPTSIKAGGLGFQLVSLRSGTVPYLTLDPQASYSIWQVKVTLQKSTRGSLVVQWLRICLPMKGRRFKPWSGK